MMVPTVHLNGTGRKDLELQLENADTALDSALDALNDAMPHGRDYYPQGPDAYPQAREEAIARMRVVRGVLDEIREIRMALHAYRL